MAYCTEIAADKISCSHSWPLNFAKPPLNTIWALWFLNFSTHFLFPTMASPLGRSCLKQRLICPRRRRPRDVWRLPRPQTTMMIGATTTSPMCCLQCEEPWLCPPGNVGHDLIARLEMLYSSANCMACVSNVSMRQEFAFFTGLLNLPHQSRDICDIYLNPFHIAFSEVPMAGLGALFHPLSMPMTFATWNIWSKHGSHKLLGTF